MRHSCECAAGTGEIRQVYDHRSRRTFLSTVKRVRQSRDATVRVCTLSHSAHRITHLTSQTQSKFQCTPHYHADISPPNLIPQSDPHRIVRNSGGPANWLGSLFSYKSLSRHSTVAPTTADRTTVEFLLSLDRCRAFVRPTGVMILRPRINDSRRRR